MPTVPFFIGTYTVRGSRGIYSAELDLATGAISPPTLAAETNNPTYLALSPTGKHLYAVSDSASLVAGFALAPDRRTLTPLAEPQPSVGKPPSHLAVDATARVALVAHYHSGYVAAVPLAGTGTPGVPTERVQHTGSGINPDRQSAPHPHCVVPSPDNRHVLVCDLGVDKIFTYRLDPAAASLTPAEPPFVTAEPGCGPRHLAFSPDARHVFMLSEMGGTLTAYRYDPDTGALHPVHTHTTLAPDFHGENKSAAIRVHPDGRFLYASNRGPETIAVLAFDPSTKRLSPVEIVPSGGAHPREIALSPDGRWLLAAHQDSDNITVFRVDPATGRLTPTDTNLPVPAPVCLVFAP
jgi:3-carboxymuconate cyclase